MGIYAQTSITIECKNKAVAKKVADIIKQTEKKNKDDFNYGFENLTFDQYGVYLFKSSDRIQNLEYQCEVLWNLIKKVKGVVELHAPFLSEADEIYFSRE